MKKLFILTLVLLVVFSLTLKSEATGVGNSMKDNSVLAISVKEIEGNKVVELRDLGAKYNWDLDYNSRTKHVTISGENGEFKFDITKGIIINPDARSILKNGKNYLDLDLINPLLSRLNEKELEMIGSLRVENEVVKMGESFKSWLEVYNLSENDINLSFSSGQLYDLYLKKGDKEVWRWSKGKAFTMAMQNKKLAAGDKLGYEVKVDGIDGPGEYMLSGEITSQPPIKLPEIKITVEE